jgi:hypothetical protein
VSSRSFSDAFNTLIISDQPPTLIAFSNSMIISLFGINASSDIASYPRYPR